MANPGAKPTGISSPAAIVRYGLNVRQRRAVARRDPWTMKALADCYGREVVEEIAVLCDKAAA